VFFGILWQLFATDFNAKLWNIITKQSRACMQILVDHQR